MLWVHADVKKTLDWLKRSNAKKSAYTHSDGVIKLKTRLGTFRLGKYELVVLNKNRNLFTIYTMATS